MYGKKDIPPLKKDPIHEYKNEILKFMVGLEKIDPISKQKEVT